MIKRTSGVPTTFSFNGGETASRKTGFVTFYLLGALPESRQRFSIIRSFRASFPPSSVVSFSLVLSGGYDRVCSSARALIAVTTNA